MHRKPPSIATNGLVQRPRLDAVERREIRVEHDAFATDDMDPRLDPGGDRLGRHTDVIGAPLLG